MLLLGAQEAHHRGRRTSVRILGVDVLTSEPSSRPVPGRAQAWAEKGDGQQTHLLIRFTDSENVLSEHRFAVNGDPIRSARTSSVIAILASHPIDVQSAIASYRVLGWTPIAQAPEKDYSEYGYALCLLSAALPNV